MRTIQSGRWSSPSWQVRSLDVRAQRASYRLCDWTPGAGTVEAWLTRWAEHGWVPEWPPPNAGVEVVVGGARRVVRWAMVRTGTFADSGADQRADQRADPGPDLVPPSSTRSLLGPSTDRHELTPTDMDSKHQRAGQSPEGPA